MLSEHRFPREDRMDTHKNARLASPGLRAKLCLRRTHPGAGFAACPGLDCIHT